MLAVTSLVLPTASVIIISPKPDIGASLVSLSGV